jgi:hypothetical protein
VNDGSDGCGSAFGAGESASAIEPEGSDWQPASKNTIENTVSMLFNFMKYNALLNKPFRFQSHHFILFRCYYY